MLSVIKAVYQKQYRILVYFSDNKKGIVDLEDYIFNGKMKPFERLRSLDAFKNFKVDYTLTWGDDLDLAPEFLYFNAFKNNSQLSTLFSEWGYV
ncbi:DUF2442 domain-containing protein [bacterium]|nr:DUF2442 domain-containing protein [bacterium]